jgi:hypothetical protein
MQVNKLRVYVLVIVDYVQTYCTVTYWVFYSRWKFISVPKTQHTIVKYTQPSPNTRRASTISYVPHKTPSTGPLLVISQHELTLLQSESFQTHMLLSQFPNTNSVFQLTRVRSQTHAYANCLGMILSYKLFLMLYMLKCWSRIPLCSHRFIC